ncbi:cell division protein FtsQ/DivIB [Vibrio gallicus]|uniref:cell division protein FtsQ/DivIB n=1 Tax=Vibrio gallicus TaxID=190897 RepID=UPI0021C3D064|nr:cell division protein FtsQ/DivIB [Vibrio gallicus]
MESVLNVETETTIARKFKFSWTDFSFFIAVVVAIAVGISATVTWMRDGGRLPLSQFVLQGDLEYVHNSDVQHALSNIMPLGTFMTQDVDQLQQAVESLPWVENASVRKQWPNTVKVFVVEHTPIAIWNGNALLDDHAVVFDADAGGLHQKDQDIVRLYGPKNSSQQVLDTWHKITPKFNALGLEITSVVLNDRRAWQLILDNGIRLELGKEALDERVERFIELYQHLDEKAQQISYIDLRYDTGAAIGWLSDQKE